MNTINKVLLVLISGLLLSCDNGAGKDSSSHKVEDSSTQRTVLATIDGENIYKSQLDIALVDMLGEYKASQVDENSRKKALDSLLAAYALSKRALQDLPEEVINEVEEKTRRYRENLLINMYMKTKLKISPFSEEEIKNYYENNLEKFGQRMVKQYQLLTTRNDLAEESRDKYMSIVSSHINAGSLEDIKKDLEGNDFPVNILAGVLDNNLLDSRLRQFIDAQKAGELSNITFIDNKPYLARITSEKLLKAKPLSEVSEVIRKSLFLKKFKEAVKEEADKALADSQITYSPK